MDPPYTNSNGRGAGRSGSTGNRTSSGRSPEGDAEEALSGGPSSSTSGSQSQEGADDPAWEGGEDLKFGSKIEIECDWGAAVNFHPRRHGTFGYLLSWTGAGGTKLTTDLNLQNPYPGTGAPGESTDADGTPIIKVAGVIEKFYYPGKPTSAIRLDCLVSRANAASLHAKFSKQDNIPNTSVSVGWHIVRSEGAGEGWYQVAWITGFAKANAKLATMPGAEKAGGHLRVNVSPNFTALKSMDGNDDIDIRLYKFRFMIVPTPGATTSLTFANTCAAPVVKVWGGA